MRHNEEDTRTPSARYLNSFRYFLKTVGIVYSSPYSLCLFHKRKLLFLISSSVGLTQSLTTVLQLQESTHHLSRSCACEAVLTAEPIRVLMMSDQLVGDLLITLFPGDLLRRMSFLRFPTSLLVIWPKYPTVRLLHKILNRTSFCILLSIEILVRCAVQDILQHTSLHPYL